MITQEIINTAVEKLRAELTAQIKLEYAKGDKVYWRGQNPGYGIINEICRYYPETSYNVIFVTGDNEVEYLSCHIENLRHVDADEWKAALIEEAKRRGYVNKVQWKLINTGDIVTRSGGNDSFGYDSERDKLLYCNYTVYKAGTWAEIITEKTSEDWVDLFYKQSAPLGTFLNKHNLQLTKK